MLYHSISYHITSYYNQPPIRSGSARWGADPGARIGEQVLDLSGTTCLTL